MKRYSLSTADFEKNGQSMAAKGSYWKGRKRGKNFLFQQPSEIFGIFLSRERPTPVLRHYQHNPTKLWGFFLSEINLFRFVPVNVHLPPIFPHDPRPFCSKGSGYPCRFSPQHPETSSPLPPEPHPTPTPASRYWLSLFAGCG